MDAATTALSPVPAHSSATPSRPPSSPFKTLQQPEVAISMRTREPLLQNRNPFITLSEGVPFTNPPHYTRVPHAFAPVTHRYTPYTRVMASAPPISLTVRGPKVPRNERGVARTRLNIISAASLSSLVASHPIIPVVLSRATPSTQPCSPRSQMCCGTPAVPTRDQSQDDEMHSDHLAPKKDSGGRNSEAE